VSWVTVLDSVPDINLLGYLPKFLDGLFNMLKDTNKDIRAEVILIFLNLRYVIMDIFSSSSLRWTQH
jgi:hypothetical protein